MINIIFGIYIFLDLLSFLIFVDIILSWLMVFQINFRPAFLANIIDTMYNFIKKYIPTTIGIFDFTPIIVIFFIYFLKGLLLSFFPEITNLVQIYSGIL